MSSCLYVAVDREIVLKEYWIDVGEKADMAEFILKEELQIQDLSSFKSFVPDSIFDPNYDHDTIWINSF